MPNTRLIYRRHRKSPAKANGVDPVARQYEGGREAPFSPRSPENDQGTPAVEEAQRRAEAGNAGKPRGKTADQEHKAGTRPGRRRKLRDLH
jgi:hypothetical protein